MNVFFLSGFCECLNVRSSLFHALFHPVVSMEDMTAFVESTSDDTSPRETCKKVRELGTL